jgi:hypothetical protein
MSVLLRHDMGDDDKKLSHECAKPSANFLQIIYLSETCNDVICAESPVTRRHPFFLSWEEEIAR